MMVLRNSLHPELDPAAYRPAHEPGDAAGQDDGGDLDQIGKDEDFIEQLPLELLEMRHRVLPDCDRVDPRLPADDGAVPQDLMIIARERLQSDRRNHPGT